MSAENLSPALLGRLPSEVRKPAYDRDALKPGIAHIGVGAFHRCHSRRNTPTTFWRRISTAGDWSASTSALPAGRHAGAAGRPLHAADPSERRDRGAHHRQHRPRRR
ncbi:hypothetical protein ACVOMV_01350 [Mesorhizobium atlanticum]